MFKKLTIVLILLLAVLSMAACADKDTKVVTNLPEQVKEQSVTLDDSKEQPDDSKEKNSKAAAENSGKTAAAKDKKNAANAGASDKEPAAAENKKPTPKQAGVAVDRETYKGYKGPVQGEIKYKEGTPADTNSSSYKAAGDIESPYHVNLTVTRDYGHTKMFGKEVGLVKDEVGMEVMFRNLDIQTAYGGGFVNKINGLESKYTFYTGSERKKLDWFYWINGILAPVGVAEYRPQAGDEIWWDYHNWDVTMFIPAVIGSYPQPFKNGFLGKNPGTVIMYTDSFQDGAQKLKKSLLNQGVKEIDTAAYNPSALENPGKYYILLGTWGDLSAASDLLQKTNLKNKLIGVYVKFENGKIQALNTKGQTVKTFDDTTGVIYAFAPGIGATRPTWLVTGTDAGGVQAALDVLVNNPSSITQFFGAVVTPNGVENVPFMN